MGRIIKTDDIAGLPLQERLDLVEAIWDTIDTDADSLPVPDWHRKVLDERVKAHATSPEAGEPWDVVRQRLLDRLGKE